MTNSKYCINCQAFLSKINNYIIYKSEKKIEKLKYLEVAKKKYPKYFENNFMSIEYLYNEYPVTISSLYNYSFLITTK